MNGKMLVAGFTILLIHFTYTLRGFLVKKILEGVVARKTAYLVQVLAELLLFVNTITLSYFIYINAKAKGPLHTALYFFLTFPAASTAFQAWGFYRFVKKTILPP